MINLKTLSISAIASLMLLCTAPAWANCDGLSISGMTDAQNQ